MRTQRKSLSVVALFAFALAAGIAAKAFILGPDLVVNATESIVQLAAGETAAQLKIDDVGSTWGAVAPHLTLSISADGGANWRVLREDYGHFSITIDLEAQAGEPGSATWEYQGSLLNPFGRFSQPGRIDIVAAEPDSARTDDAAGSGGRVCVPTTDTTSIGLN